jgi:hypothetical protein
MQEERRSPDVSEQLHLEGVSPLPQEPKEGLTLEFLSKLFDCTERNVQLLEQKKVIERTERGLYRPDSVTRYIKYLRVQGSGKVNTPQMTEAKERSELARARFLELKVGKLASELHHTRDIKHFIGGAIKNAVSRLRSLPSEHGASWFRCRSEVELVEAAQKALDSALASVAELSIDALSNAPIEFSEFNEIERDEHFNPAPTNAEPVSTADEGLAAPTEDDLE